MEFRQTKAFEKGLERCPRHVRTKALGWIGMASLYGLAEARKSKGYHDEPLLGKRKGQRSIRLNTSYRLVYTEDGGIINLLELTKHDY